MKKSTFDYAPELVEYEGKVVRINFDVEQVQETVPSMDGGEDIVRNVYKVSVIRVPQPLTVDSVKEALLAEGYNEIKADAIATEVILTLVLDGKASGDSLALAKEMMIAKITEHDNSTAVNNFTYNGIDMWLGRELRQTLITRFDAEKTAKRSESILRYGPGANEVITLTPSQGLSLVKDLECYAADCFTVTEDHKAAVMALEDFDEVIGYDFTTGYPPQRNY